MGVPIFERDRVRKRFHNRRISLGVNDTERMEKAAKGIVGKRLTYRRIGRAKEIQTDDEIPF